MPKQQPTAEIVPANNKTAAPPLAHKIAKDASQAQNQKVVELTLDSPEFKTTYIDAYHHRKRFFEHFTGREVAGDFTEFNTKSSAYKNAYIAAFNVCLKRRILIEMGIHNKLFKLEENQLKCVASGLISELYVQYVLEDQCERIAKLEAKEITRFADGIKALEHHFVQKDGPILEEGELVLQNGEPSWKTKQKDIPLYADFILAGVEAKHVKIMSNEQRRKFAELRISDRDKVCAFAKAFGGQAARFVFHRGTNFVGALFDHFLQNVGHLHSGNMGDFIDQYYADYERKNPLPLAELVGRSAAFAKAPEPAAASAPRTTVAAAPVPAAERIADLTVDVRRANLGRPS